MFFKQVKNVSGPYTRTSNPNILQSILKPATRSIPTNTLFSPGTDTILFPPLLVDVADADVDEDVLVVELSTRLEQVWLDGTVALLDNVKSAHYRSVKLVF